MDRTALRTLLLLCTAATAFAQSAPPDSPSLQALVAEIHQLRQEMQATTVAAQRVQIALFRMQSQTAIVARAASRLDDVRGRVSQAQGNHSQLSARLHSLEDRQRGSQDANELKAMAEVVPQLKLEIERETAEEQRLQAIEAEAASQFRVEQAKLSELQDLLDKLDKILDGYGKK